MRHVASISSAYMTLNSHPSPHDDIPKPFVELFSDGFVVCLARICRAGTPSLSFSTPCPCRRCGPKALLVHVLDPLGYSSAHCGGISGLIFDGIWRRGTRVTAQRSSSTIAGTVRSKRGRRTKLTAALCGKCDRARPIGCDNSSILY